MQALIAPLFSIGIVGVAKRPRQRTKRVISLRNILLWFHKRRKKNDRRLKLSKGHLNGGGGAAVVFGGLIENGVSFDGLPETSSVKN